MVVPQVPQGGASHLHVAGVDGGLEAGAVPPALLQQRVVARLVPAVEEGDLPHPDEAPRPGPGIKKEKAQPRPALRLHYPELWPRLKPSGCHSGPKVLETETVTVAEAPAGASAIRAKC